MHTSPRRWCSLAHLLLSLLLVGCFAVQAAPPPGAPAPLLSKNHPVDWWFVFKFNTKSMPGCDGSEDRTCAFGGTLEPDKLFSQQFAFASSAGPKLQQGGGCVGEGPSDPVGATFDEVYDGDLFYVVWNDQFEGDPIASKGGPAGHSKGVLAWDKNGNGFVLQVSTPSWPASGSSKHPRKTDGNTLGCVADNNLLVSQHFFALKLNKNDVIAVLNALANASVVTDPDEIQIVNSGGPDEIQSLVKNLGTNSKSTTATATKLSTGVLLISKPSRLNVPPWQMVSALLGGEPLRTATWWHAPLIPTSRAGKQPGCWDESLDKPGAVEIATTGTWQGNPIGLRGVAGPDGNHAKIGVSTGTHTYAIFGDLNQQGSLNGPHCDSSQNGRGGLFYVIENATLSQGIGALLKGDSAPAH